MEIAKFRMEELDQCSIHMLEVLQINLIIIEVEVVEEVRVPTMTI